jgi:DNA topoisomerase I
MYQGRPASLIVSTSTGRESARHAGLRYVTDQTPGIRRTRSGGAFRYWNPSGKPLKDPTTLRRIKAIAIPPAWTKVWICPDPAGHIQATGRDARKRKQYRYHRGWRETRDENKYGQMIAFARALPKIRRRVRQDLRRRGLGREKVIAAIVRLLELSSARVGNSNYAKENGSFGLTTLRDRHFQLKDSLIHLRFRGKGGKEHRLTLDDPRLARIVKRCQDLPGQDLFQYVDDTGAIHTVTSSDVNAYLARITGDAVTAKVFRTWTGTVQAAVALRRLKRAKSRTEARRNIGLAIEQVAQHLGNTPTVCKNCYVHPVILDAYSAGTFAAVFRVRNGSATPSSSHRLRPEEAAVVVLLKRKPKETTDDTLEENLAKSLRRCLKKSPLPRR